MRRRGKGEEEDYGKEEEEEEEGEKSVGRWEDPQGWWLESGSMQLGQNVSSFYRSI